jgi:hypothetical protein
MAMAKAWRNLHEKTDDELIREYDQQAEQTQIGLGYYLDELSRRENRRQTDEMLRLTNTITHLTRVITGLTVVNTFLVIVSLVL